MPDEMDYSMSTAVEAAASMSTSTSNQPPPFSDQERIFIASLFFNYDIHERNLEVLFVKENRQCLVNEDLKYFPERSESEIRAELRRLCDDFRMPNRQPRPWDIYLCPPQENNDIKADWILQLSNNKKIFGVVQIKYLHKRRKQLEAELGRVHDSQPKDWGIEKTKSYKKLCLTKIMGLDELEQTIKRGWPKMRERSDVVALVSGYSG
ncbi:MAG: hypothetical protein Q9193_002298 [Seirophora villosa]